MNQPPFQLPLYAPNPLPKKQTPTWWILLGIIIGIFSCLGCVLLTPRFLTTQQPKSLYSRDSDATETAQGGATFLTPTATESAPANPWGYNFEPEAHHYIYDAPANFCRYFKCLQPFGTANDGFVVECTDGKFSHSGGNPDACLYDGGVWRALYWH